jgi:hypothetical protein
MKLREALRKRFKTPEEILEALGMDARDIGADIVGDAALSRARARVRAEGTNRRRDYHLRRLAQLNVRFARDANLLEDPNDPGEVIPRASGDDMDFSDVDPSHIGLCRFLREKGLSDDEIAEALATVSSDDDVLTAGDEEDAEGVRTAASTDQPLPFAGRPRPGGAMDGFRRRFPMAARIGIVGGGAEEDAACARAEARRRAVSASIDAGRDGAGAAARTFEERFPVAARIRHAL